MMINKTNKSNDINTYNQWYYLFMIIIIKK